MKPLNYGRLKSSFFFFAASCSFHLRPRSTWTGFGHDTAGCSIPPHLRASCTVYALIAMNPWINLLPPDPSPLSLIM